jgi:hypothetical protein
MADVFDHNPCCSSHKIPMSCEKYRLTHFVEVRPCCAIDAERLLGRDSKEQVTLDILRRADPDDWSTIAGHLVGAAMRRSMGASPEQIAARFAKEQGIRE